MPCKISCINLISLLNEIHTRTLAHGPGLLYFIEKLKLELKEKEEKKERKKKLLNRNETRI